MSDSESGRTGFPRVVGGGTEASCSAPTPGPCICHQAFTFYEMGVFNQPVNTLVIKKSSKIETDSGTSEEA